MYLAFPSLAVKVDGDFGKIGFGGGTMRDGINIFHLRPRAGDMVLVRAGYAIQITDEVDAAKTIEYWEANVSWKCDRCPLLHECLVRTYYLHNHSTRNHANRLASMLMTDVLCL